MPPPLPRPMLNTRAPALVSDARCGFDSTAFPSNITGRLLPRPAHHVERLVLAVRHREYHRVRARRIRQLRLELAIELRPVDDQRVVARDRRPALLRLAHEIFGGRIARVRHVLAVAHAEQHQALAFQAAEQRFEPIQAADRHGVVRRHRFLAEREVHAFWQSEQVARRDRREQRILGQTVAADAEARLPDVRGVGRLRIALTTSIRSTLSSSANRPHSSIKAIVMAR